MTFDKIILNQRNSQVMLQPEEELQLTKFLMDRAADAVFWVDSEARFLYVNDAGCCMARYSREDITLDDYARRKSRLFGNSLVRLLERYQAARLPHL